MNSSPTSNSIAINANPTGNTLDNQLKKCNIDLSQIMTPATELILNVQNQNTSSLSYLSSSESKNNIDSILQILSKYNYNDYKCGCNGNSFCQQTVQSMTGIINFLNSINLILDTQSPTIKKYYPNITKFVNDMESDVMTTQNPVIINKFNSIIIKLNDIFGAVTCASLNCPCPTCPTCPTCPECPIFNISTYILAGIILILIIIIIVK
ncbi:hypothetical protein BMW23_0701 [Bodo saltans virus]|uniref:Uncharacterized protein n=1 Tax=Bodo saltans virus TaxID=2024608 RepID=A0A2H4UV58_9VIRU|nr:hypothetical protein QJ851_gp0684 [Bodo saltans virus]ATZ80747.1 hypothetical protein BMW23_0701 [Bodo saltans virus]